MRNLPYFTFAESPLEVVFDYMYLGVKFNYNWRFTKAKVHMFEKASRAMFALLKKLPNFIYR